MKDELSTILSIILLFIGLYLYKKSSPSKTIRSVFALMVLCYTVFFIAHLIANYFTGDGIDEATIYHIKYGLNGSGFLEYGWFITFIVLFIVFTLIGLSIYIFSIPINRGRNKNKSLFPFVFIFFSLCFNPTSLDLYGLYGSILGNNKTGKNDIFYHYYKDPQINSLNKGDKNIVFIYAESLERTYFDETIFPGLIKGLRVLESKSTYFTNINGRVNGTTWTVGGMTASQCGIPLFTPSHGNSMSGMDSFLPGVTCLGDLLKKEGYNLNYAGGADLDFAGKGKLYKTHGFSSVQGRDELLPKLEDDAYKTDWGLYDDSLFNLLYKQFVKLSKRDEKFGLFTLTLDTHHPYGHASAKCKDIKYADGSNQILNAVACSDYLISDFVNKILQSPYADNTIVVLASDHLAMRNTASHMLQKKERNNLFMIIDPSDKKSKEIRTIGSTLDIGPTILPFIGFSGDIGLGRNLLDRKMLAGDRLYIHANLVDWRQEITEYWNFPKINESLVLRAKEKVINIDSREFKFPILIELNEKLESVLKFQFNKSRGHKSLVRHLSELDEYFILVDECSRVYQLNTSLGKEGYCLLSGYGDTYIKAIKLKGDVEYSKHEVLELLGMQQNNFETYRVAHAGGGVNNETYTNSFEALESSKNKGFKYFEIDFSFTKDGRLVCLHDWEHSFNRSFGFDTNERVTFEEFILLVKTKSKYKKCTASNLAEWSMKNPDTYIITDVKDKNIEALKMLFELFPDAKNRVIPQVYLPQNLKKVRNIGYENFIWTLYRFGGSNAKVLAWVDGLPSSIFNKMAITMPKSRASSKLPKSLERRGIPSFVHTVNTPYEEEKYINQFGVTNLYTDFLKP